MEPEEATLAALLSPLRSGNSNSWSWWKIRDVLVFIRDKRLRRSELVYKYGSVFLDKYSGKLPEHERLQLREQVLIAALDCGQYDDATKQAAILRKRFPASTRVQRLEAMIEEGRGRYDQALKMYQSILEKEKTDPLVMKRCIVIWRAKGQLDRATHSLNEFLKYFSNDLESWQELADLYLQQCAYTEAAYCIEELLLFSPENIHYYNRYADVLYTIGGTENLQKAKKYYAKSLEMRSANNMRAAWGLLLTCRQIMEGNKKDVGDAAQVAAWTAALLCKKYKASGVARASLALRYIAAVLPSE